MNKSDLVESKQNASFFTSDLYYNFTDGRLKYCAKENNMSAKANGPGTLPAVDTVQEQGYLGRLFSCFKKKNIGANGRVVPSNTVIE